MDADGYPTDEELDRIRAWPYQDCGGLLEFVLAECWWMPSGREQQNNRRWRLATGGWSGNEEVIAALEDNHMFMALCWQSSHRGGLHIFQVPKINMGSAAIVEAPETDRHA